ncbi:pyridoxamine 5'-phosphate oxidase family protein [Halopseudomonas phragmitis]|uniref:pyridoxamine 5'-phosphate oxidase family protein n=1 Tax=Halopseudomonas phragmitis TaxID=1931241 RepID=UPI001C480205|nr:pyridoxamine 5'-phosphate oxidase family protein [Halopseudomonas phragmitis]
MLIESVEALRALYPPAKERALKKQLVKLDEHCQRFIALSPFVVLASGNSSGLDASPRGGAPGFVQVEDECHLLIPDSPGNNRLDSLENLIARPEVGLLFMIPGIDETLRVNGIARLLAEPALCARFADDKRAPRLVIRVEVREAYLHCAKALMRSGLWAKSSRQPREVLPSMGQMIKDQTGDTAEPETQAQMLARYEADL